ncbi:MAG: alpha/beta fold hydrolase [Myxococcota bacterium]
MREPYPLEPPTVPLWAELDAVRELLFFPPAWMLTRRRTPRGAARVVVLPGFLTGDGSTWPLRRALSSLGHEVRGWGLGTNRGNVPKLLPRVRQRIEALAGGDPVHLVGWSLGGYLAREVARDRPDLVRQVITLASPIIGGPKYTVTARRYASQGYDLDAIEAEVSARTSSPLQVPVTAFYSARDAIVSPAACIDRSCPQTEHVEVDASHLGMGVSASVIRLVAERLAHPRPSASVRRGQLDGDGAGA